MKGTTMTQFETLGNKFEEGMVITTKVDPAVKLIINTYLDRVYFCVRVGDRTGKEVPYFEGELQNIDQSYFKKKVN
jgi:hypothetical protein